MQCAPGLREEWGRGPEKTPPEENGRLEKETGAALPAGQRKGRAEMSGKAGGRPGMRRRPRRQARPFLRMRRRARVRMRGARRVQQCAFGRRVRAACGTAGRTGGRHILPGMRLRAGTGEPFVLPPRHGACLGCAHDVDEHTPFLPACPVCGGVLFGNGEGRSAALYGARV